MGIELIADGLGFDADGRMWFTDLGKSHSGIRTASGLFSALPNGAAITTITPDGDTRFRGFDDRYVTNIAFGGDDMMDAYLTLSTSGRLVKLRWDEPGLKLHFNG